MTGPSTTISATPTPRYLPITSGHSSRPPGLPRERLLVVALCAWGLRTGEVAALHARQLVLDDENPHIRFDERKNGLGTVAVIYGADTVSRPPRRTGRRRRLVRLSLSVVAVLDGPPVEEHHRELVRRPPRQGRRPRSDRRTEHGPTDGSAVLVRPLLGHRRDARRTPGVGIADEQGSASADVVWHDYLSAERRRELRRQFMRGEKLSAAFESRDGN